ncbi:hypothetical protein HDU76_007906 [Blyttiomyces sp. JEL0837]|nr:hypothetical protein HDU76_007906 [Blyttiomyces sp. JEL0837]
MTATAAQMATTSTTNTTLSTSEIPPSASASEPTRSHIFQQPTEPTISSSTSSSLHLLLSAASTAQATSSSPSLPPTMTPQVIQSIGSATQQDRSTHGEPQYQRTQQQLSIKPPSQAPQQQQQSTFLTPSTPQASSSASIISQSPAPSYSAKPPPVPQQQQRQAQIGSPQLTQPATPQTFFTPVVNSASPYTGSPMVIPQPIILDTPESSWLPPRMVLDQSIATCLMDHMFSDPAFEIMGYLGGRILKVKDLLPGYGKSGPADVYVCHVTHFLASERSVGSLYLGDVAETDDAYAKALSFFNEMRVDFVGWYKSNNPMKQPIPSQQDLKRQHELQLHHPGCIGLILSMTCSNRPSRFFPEVADPAITSPFVAPVHCMRAFRAVSDRSGGGAGGDGLGLGVAQQLVEADEVFVAVLEQAFMDPDAVRSLHRGLSTALDESVNAYDATASNFTATSGTTHQRLVLDTQMDSYLMNFWNSGILEAARGVQYELERVAIAKASIREWVMGRIDALKGVYDSALSKAREMGIAGTGAALPKSFDQVLKEITIIKSDPQHDPLQTSLTKLITGMSTSSSIAPTPLINPTAITTGPLPTLINPLFPNIHQHPGHDPSFNASHVAALHAAMAGSDLGSKKARKTRKDKGEKRKRKALEEAQAQALAAAQAQMQAQVGVIGGFGDGVGVGVGLNGNGVGGFGYANGVSDVGVTVVGGIVNGNVNGVGVGVVDEATVSVAMDLVGIADGGGNVQQYQQQHVVDNDMPGVVLKKAKLEVQVDAEEVEKERERQARDALLAMMGSSSGNLIS